MGCRQYKALRYFRRVLGVCVWLPAVHLEPGEVIARSWPVVGQFHIGRWPAPLRTEADDEFLQQLAQAWSLAGIRVNPVEDVAPWKYNKLLSNLANAVGALSAEGADFSAVTAALRAEGEKILRSAGIEFVSFEVSTAARANGPTPRAVPGCDTGAGNSTWQSLSRNTGNVETDFLNGEIVRIANRHGANAPINAALARISRGAVRNGLGPVGYSAAQLAESIGIARHPAACLNGGEVTEPSLASSEEESCVRRVLRREQLIGHREMRRVIGAGHSRDGQTAPRRATEQHRSESGDTDAQLRSLSGSFGTASGDRHGDGIVR